MSNVSSNEYQQSHYYDQRLSVAISLSLGDQLLSKNDFDGAKDAFESAYQYLSASPSSALSQRSKMEDLKTKQEQAIASNLRSDSSGSPLSPTPSTKGHVDTYQEDECDVGPRTFHEAIVPHDVMGVNANVLHLVISYNQALVYHAQENYSLAAQLYKFITATIAAYLSAGNPSDTTLSHLAMRSHNNMGQIEYKERSEKEYAHIEFENALSYIRHDQYQHQEYPINKNLTIEAYTPDHQLEIAMVLSNWCRTRWMLRCVDDSMYAALENILRIRSTHMEQNHPDVAAANFNLGRAEFSRTANQKALKHFLTYIQISSQRYQEKNKLNGGSSNSNSNSIVDDSVDFELDPIQGLIYVLQIQDDKKDDEVSQDLLWGLRALQEKRKELGSIHTEVASVLNYIGTLLFRRRELDYALCFFAQELRVEERLRSQHQASENVSSSAAGEDVSISVTCNNIGRILQELGRYQEAKYYYRRSLGNDCDNDDTTSSSDTAPACNCTIDRTSKNNSMNAGQQSKKARNKQNIYEKSKRNENDDNEDGNTSEVPPAVMNLYSTVWYNLGLIHDKMGAFKEAIRAFRMSLKLRRAMLGHDHTDVSCLLYNIGVLQMEQNLLDEATESFREALEHRHISGKGQLNDHHVIKTLKKLSSMHKAKGDLNSALKANRDILSVLTTSTDFKHTTRNRKIAVVMREIADLNQAQGNLQEALEHAIGSVNLFRLVRTTSSAHQLIEDNDMDVENSDAEKETTPIIEQETNSLLLVGSLKHELCDTLNAQVAFSEAARLIHFTLSSSTKFAPALLPLLEVSAMLASGPCAAAA